MGNIFEKRGIESTVVPTPFGRVFGINDVTIDGERFLLSVPTTEQWMHLTQYFVDHRDVYFEGFDMLGKDDADIVAQHIYQLDPQLVKLRAEEIPVGPDDEVHIKHYSVYPTMAFLPMLIPYDREGKFDVLNHEEAFEVFHGGTFYIDEIPSDIYVEDMTDVISCGEAGTHRFKIGDTADNADPNQIIPWMQVDFGYIGMIPLLSEVRYDLLLKKFRGGV